MPIRRSKLIKKKRMTQLLRLKRRLKRRKRQRLRIYR